MIWGSFACIQLRWQSPFCLTASPSLESNCVSCCHCRAGRSCCCPKTSARLPLQSPLPLSSSPPYRFTFLFRSVSCFMIPPHKLTKSCRQHAIVIFSTTTCCLRLRESLSTLVNRIKLLSHACSKYPASFSPYRFSFLFSSVDKMSIIIWKRLC